MTYPLHKSIHLLFFLPYRKSFKVHKLTKRKWLIFYNTYVNQPVHKFYFCINLILPLIILSAMFVYLTILFPNMDIILCSYWQFSVFPLQIYYI